MIRPTDLVRQLSLADKQVVEILRAVHARQAVLLLDEPTSALPAGRVEWFYELVEVLRDCPTARLVYLTPFGRGSRPLRLRDRSS